MKPGVRIVNCARGGIVHEGDLLAALESGHVAGAAVDVWSEEPPVSDLVKRLVTHPHVVVTPHLGANTQEAQINVAVDVARELVAFRDGELVEHAVNVPVGDRESMAAQRPFLPWRRCSGGSACSSSPTTSSVWTWWWPARSPAGTPS